MIDESAPRLVLSVGAFTARMVRWFDRASQLKQIGIEGEISGLHEFGNGHLGFTLKEGQAVLECVAWSSFRRNFPRLGNGAQAIAYGSVRIHPERGGYKLYVESLEPAGLGALYLLYERLKETFTREGLFDAGRKRAVPELPRRVALITARGKAKQDFEETLRRNVPFVDVRFIETRVQGLGAEIDVAAAIDRASQLGVDAIVLTRGGGTFEDLFTFNLEPVVRAIVRATAPVLTAIGHSSDHHLADDVADRSFGTPSLVAEFIAKGWGRATARLEVALRDLERGARGVGLRAAQRLDAARGHVERAGLRVLASKRGALNASVVRLDRSSPQRSLADARARLAAGGGRLDTSAARLISRKAHRWGETRNRLDRAVAAMETVLNSRLQRALASLERCDPLAPLRRGYAIVAKDGRALVDAATVRPGDTITARLERGMLEARVESVMEVPQNG